jgi:N6-adenosine-specific RNA methylase IME4
MEPRRRNPLRRYPTAVCISVLHSGLTHSKTRALNSPAMLPEAIDVMRAWGFTYRSHLIWIKDRIGTGYWCRNRHEILLIGSKGTVPAPAPGEQPQSALEAAVGQHSEKPARFAELIKQLFPRAPCIELFARSPRSGWDTCGNEVVAEHGST